LHTQVSQLQTTGEAQEDYFGLRWFLLFIALLEGFEAVLELPLIIDRPNLLFGARALTPPTPPGVFLAKLHLVAHPLLAIAAFTLTVAGNVRGALVAFAAICVVAWLSILPMAFALRLQSWWDIQWVVAQLLVFPLLAGTVIALAVLTSRYRLAAALVAFPTLYNALGTVMFVVRVILINM
jgi:hypothetical protein